jgi:hypothetical protein
MQSEDRSHNPGAAEPQSYGRYRVLELLGEGAMGRVYLSEDPILKRKVAVKVISTDRGLDPTVLAGYLERFAVEAQACARLNHTSIVSIYDAGEQDGVPWIAFEYVSGEHLDRLIARQKQLSFDRILRIAGDIAAAMQHAHGLNIVHRDIKPANILIDDKSQVAKLADFGVVKSPFSAVTQCGTAVGSPGYMSPEQIDDLKVDPRSDLFSFGIVLYEMITGTHPFLKESVQATFFATINCNYTPVRTLRPDAPEKLVRIVEKSLVADRNLRIIDAEELCALIAGCMDDMPRKTAMMNIVETRRGAVRRAKFLGAAALRKCRGFWKSASKRVPPVCRSAAAKAAEHCRRVSSVVTEFFRATVYPPVSRAFNRIYTALRKRFTDKQLKIAMAALSSLVAVAVMAALISAANARIGDRNVMLKAAQELGYNFKSGRELVYTCRAYLDVCDYWHSARLAEIIAAGKGREYALKGALYKAMATLCVERFDEAAEMFAEIRKRDGGESAIRKEHPFFIKYLEGWIERELPKPLVHVSADQLFLHNNHRLRVWTKNHHYWIRWNAVRILERGNEKVDRVPVYILDLDHSGSDRTKVRAAEELGRIGDRRAVPALIATRDGRGPAAAAARKVLREKFNVW